MRYGILIQTHGLFVLFFNYYMDTCLTTTAKRSTNLLTINILKMDYFSKEGEMPKNDLYFLLKYNGSLNPTV